MHFYIHHFDSINHNYPRKNQAVLIFLVISAANNFICVALFINTLYMTAEDECSNCSPV